MDNFTLNHLTTWLDNTIHPDERAEAKESILAFLLEYPNLPEEGRSWPEIRTLAERKGA